MARINIEDKALRDPRFKVLAAKTGRSHYDTILRTALLWRQCAEDNTYCLSAAIIDGLTDSTGYAEMLADPDVGLAERVEVDGRTMYRIRGTEGRVEWLAAKRENGKKGGRPKSAYLDAPSPKPIANLELTETEPTPNPPSSFLLSPKDKDNTGQSLDRPTGEYPEEFEQVYAQYPRKVKKAAGFKIYRKQIKTEAERQRLLEAIRKYRREKAGKEAEFIMHFSSFMACWTDYAPKTPPVNSSPGLSTAVDNSAHEGLLAAALERRRAFIAKGTPTHE